MNCQLVDEKRQINSPPADILEVGVVYCPHAITNKEEHSHGHHRDAAEGE